MKSMHLYLIAILITAVLTGSLALANDAKLEESEKRAELASRNVNVGISAISFAGSMGSLHFHRKLQKWEQTLLWGLNPEGEKEFFRLQKLAHKQPNNYALQRKVSSLAKARMDTIHRHVRGLNRNLVNEAHLDDLMNIKGLKVLTGLTAAGFAAITVKSLYNVAVIDMNKDVKIRKLRQDVEEIKPTVSDAK